MSGHGFPNPQARGAFRSFWMGGFENADGPGDAHDAAQARDPTQHDVLADQDYRRLKEFGIRTVRESLGWRQIEQGGRYDFSPVRGIAEAARARGLQVIWTLCHYGWPDDVDPMARSFPLRFAQYAAQAARFLRRHTEGAPVFVPINEPTYLAWSVCGGGRARGPGGRADSCTRALRRQLAQAAILACEAILDVDPRARFIHTDPLMRLAAPAERPELGAACEDSFEDQFYYWDIITGAAEAALGGGARYADYLGINYYQANQADLVSGKPLAWQLDDPRRMPLSVLLQSVYERYARPMLIAETGHRGVRRGRWIREVAEEVRRARGAGVPVEGICLYPLIDRPDWHNPQHWHDCGFWDVEVTADGRRERHLNGEFAAGLRAAQRSIPRLPQFSGQSSAIAETSSQYSTAPGKSLKTSDSSRQPRATA